MTFLIALLLFLLFILIWPSMQSRLIEGRRFAYLRRLEERRKSRVITLIDRRRGVSIFGVPFWEFIDIEDAEEILRAVRLTPKEVPIDLVVHTPGGLALATEQIARTLLGHQGKVTIFIPHYAMSGGTLLALAADEIVMDRRAVLGGVDPQIGGFPAGAVLSVLKQKPADKISDRTYIMADVAKKALDEIYQFVEQLLTENRYDAAAVKKITDALVGGERTHDYPITYTQAKELGLRVSTSMPPEIYGLLALYPPRRGARSPVQYVPVPYGGRGTTPRHS